MKAGTFPTQWELSPITLKQEASNILSTDYFKCKILTGDMNLINI